jgi:hypothetical protein
MNIGEIEKIWEIEPRPAEPPLPVPDPEPERIADPEPDREPVGRTPSSTDSA